MNEKNKISIKNTVVALILLGVIGYGILWILGTLLNYIGDLVERLNHIASNLDTVVIVVLITGAVSITGVVISSIISKYIEYRQNIKRYLYE